MSTPLWLFTGPELGERNTAVGALRTRAEKKYGELDTHVFYAGETSMGIVLDTVQNGTLFAGARFVIVKNAEAIKKKDDIEVLVEWAAHTRDEQGAFLILLSDEIGIDKKIEALVPQDKKKVFWELFENKKQEWVRRFFAQSKISIEPEAIDVLLELVENNTQALRESCTAISLFFEPGTGLTVEKLENVLAHNKEETPFTLFDALSTAHFEYALSIRRKLSLSKESSPVQLIAALAYCFRRLLDWHRLQREGQRDPVHLKKAGFISKKAIEQCRNASTRWNEQAVRRIIALLNTTDMKIRTTGNELQGLLLDACLYSIMYKQGEELSPYDYHL